MFLFVHLNMCSQTFLAYKTSVHLEKFSSAGWALATWRRAPYRPFNCVLDNTYLFR